MLRRWSARVLALTALVAAVVVGPWGSSAAQAADCKPEGVPNAAGSGLPGLIDDPVPNPSGKTYYGDYGWAGLKWHTCDLGAGPDAVQDPIAVLDTYFGNVGMGAATVESSSMTQLHEWAVDPGELLEPVDRVVARVTEILRRALWNEWAPVFIIVAAIVIVWHANTQQVRRSLSTVVAILISCGVVGWIMMGPVKAAQMFDNAVSSVVGGVDESIVNVTGNADLSDEEARGSTFHDEILYRLWCRGALSNEQIGDKYCPKLYEANAVAYEDLDDYDSDDYRDAYNDVADDLEDEDESYYDALKGKQYNRSGQGFISVVMMSMIALIRIPAEILMVAGLLVMRLAVMLGPIFALAGILEATRSLAIAAFKMVLASVINVAVYGIIAALHTAVIAGVIAADPGMIATLVIVAILTILFWKLSKPFRSPTKLASGAEAGEQMAGVGDTSRMSQLAMGLLGAKLGGVLGNRGGGSDDDEEDDRRDEDSDRDENYPRDDDEQGPGPNDPPDNDEDDGDDDSPAPGAGDPSDNDNDGEAEDDRVHYAGEGVDRESDDDHTERDLHVVVPDYVPRELLREASDVRDSRSTDESSAPAHEDAVLEFADAEGQARPEPDLVDEEVRDHGPITVDANREYGPINVDPPDSGDPDITVLTSGTHATHEVRLVEPEYTSEGDLSYSIYRPDRDGEPDGALAPNEGGDR